MKAARIFPNKVREIKSREFKLSEIDSETKFNTTKVSKLQHESYQTQHTQSYRSYYGVSNDEQMMTNEILLACFGPNSSNFHEPACCYIQKHKLENISSHKYHNYSGRPTVGQSCKRG